MRAPEENLRVGLGYERAGVLDRALEQYHAVLTATRDPRLVARTLIRISHTYRTRCEWDAGLAAAARATTVAQDAHLDALHGEALNAEAAIYHSRGDFERAEAVYRRIADVTRNARVRGMAAQNLGAVAGVQGRLDAAEAHFLEAFDFFEAAGDESGQAHVLNSYTALAVDRQDWAQAEERGRRAIEAAMQVGDLDLLGIARYNYAEALCGLGRFVEAEEAAAAALGYFQAAGNRLRRVHSLRTLGLLKERQEQWELARRFYDRALDAATTIGADSEIAMLTRHLADLSRS